MPPETSSDNKWSVITSSFTTVCFPSQSNSVSLWDTPYFLTQMTENDLLPWNLYHSSYLRSTVSIHFDNSSIPCNEEKTENLFPVVSLQINGFKWCQNFNLSQNLKEEYLFSLSQFPSMEIVWIKVFMKIQASKKYMQKFCWMIKKDRKRKQGPISHEKTLGKNCGTESQ